MSSVVYKANLYLFTKGIGDGGEYYRTFNSSTWSGWSKLVGTTEIAMNASVHNANLYLFAKGINDAVIYAQSFDGFNWSGWSVVGDTTKVSVGGKGSLILLATVGLIQKANPRCTP